MPDPSDVQVPSILARGQVEAHHDILSRSGSDREAQCHHSERGWAMRRAQREGETGACINVGAWGRGRVSAHSIPPKATEEEAGGGGEGFLGVGVCLQ